MKKLLSILIALLLLTARPALAMVVWDFEDGTTQGWSNSESGFMLSNPGSGGNPGGFAQLTDTSSGGDGGYAEAPIELLNELRVNPTGYQTISWDTRLPSGAFEQVSLVIFNNITEYTYTPVAPPLTNIWQSPPWQAPLDDNAGWSCTLGCSSPDSVADVVASITRLAFDLEVTNRGSSFSHNLEAGLDNVRLNPIPVPPAVWLFGSGLLGLIGVARRRKS